MNTSGCRLPHIWQGASREGSGGHRQFGTHMTSEQKVANGRDGTQGSLLVLAFLALIVGAISGFVGAVFLLLLERADRFRDAVIVWAHSRALVGFSVVVIACAAGAGVAAWLVRRYSPQRQEAASHMSRRF